jgi:hypothetical protein
MATEQVEAKGARGSAFIELRLEGRCALSLLTEGWTAEEVASLERGDPEARAEAEALLITRVLNEPDECDTVRFDLVFVSTHPEGSEHGSE